MNNRQEIIERLNETKKEKYSLLLKLKDYEGGSSSDYINTTNEITNQIISKNDNIKYLNSLLYADEKKSTSPREVLLIIVFIISIIAIIASK